MKKLTANEQRPKDIAATEAALAETRADIAAGRVVKESAEAHVNRLNKVLLNNDNALTLTQRDFEAFASSVKEPPNPKVALRKLMARK
ncbi:MAG: DUF1778 domain-containing protein [Nitrosomonadales bacterium]|nr:DUF1778 domain-containing protein [Nitrosomonadales bacterium]